MEKRYCYSEWKKAGFPAHEHFLKPYDILTQSMAEKELGRCDVGDSLYLQGTHCSDVLGAEGLYNTYARPDGNSPFRYMGLCKKGETVNAHPEPAKKVFIISQLRSDDKEEDRFHINFARAAAKREWKRGNFPIVPQIYFTEFLDDKDLFQRDWAIAAGHIMMQECDEVKIYMIDGIISEGMRFDIKFATLALGIDPEINAFTRAQAKRLIENGDI